MWRSHGVSWAPAALVSLQCTLCILRPTSITGTVFSCMVNNQLRRHEFSFGGYSKSSSGVQGRNPYRGLGLSETEAVCRRCLLILPAETIKVWKFRPHNLLPDYWPICFTLGGATICRGVAPKPLPGASTANSVFKYTNFDVYFRKVLWAKVSELPLCMGSGYNVAPQTSATKPLSITAILPSQTPHRHNSNDSKLL